MNSVIVYVDGSNLLREAAKAIGVKSARADKPSAELLEIGRFLTMRAFPYGGEPLRRYWFSSFKGDDSERDRIRSFLREAGIEPVLFKQREGREKGVDIALTKEMLVHAFHRNCVESILVAGDEDYVSLVQEVKRYGQKVTGFFLAQSMSEELRLSLDSFKDLTTSLDAGPCRNAVEKLQNEDRKA